MTLHFAPLAQRNLNGNSTETQRTSTKPQRTRRYQSKKMTEEEFINNNRGIDNGESLPAQLLSELYQGIVNNEILTTKEVWKVFTNVGH